MVTLIQSMSDFIRGTITNAENIVLGRCWRRMCSWREMADIFAFYGFTIKLIRTIIAFFNALLNSVVHTVMYSYYGLAAVGPHMQKYLWWKRYLTNLQLTQFVIYLLHSTCNLMSECDYPDSINVIGMVYSLTLVVLFSNFYYKSYLTKKMEKHSV